MPGSTFKKTIKGCVEDGLVEHGRSRYFVTDDNCRVEVPIHSEFYFGADRYEFIDRLKRSLIKNVKKADNQSQVLLIQLSLGHKMETITLEIEDLDVNPVKMPVVIEDALTIETCNF